MEGTFTDEQWRDVLVLAQERSRHSRASGLPDLRVGQHHSSELIDVIGTAGEMAVAMALGVAIQRSDSPDGWVDGWLADGRSYDVKATEVPTGHLLPQGWHAGHHADVLILCIVDVVAHSVRIAGWLSAGEFAARARVRGHVSPDPCVPQEQLRSFEELWHSHHYAIDWWREEVA